MENLRIYITKTLVLTTSLVLPPSTNIRWEFKRD
jgi:hypothetical protein